MVGYKLKLNSVLLSHTAVTHRDIFVCVQRDLWGVLVFENDSFTRNLRANRNECELCESYICSGVKYYFAIFHLHLPATLPPSLILSLSLCCTFSLCSMEVKNGVGDQLSAPVDHRKKGMTILTE